MAIAAFDSLSSFEKLKSVGVPEEQAKAQVEIMQSFVINYDEVARKDLATKGDLQELRAELKSDIQETKHELLKWMMGMFLAQTAMLIAVIAFIK